MLDLVLQKPLENKYIKSRSVLKNLIKILIKIKILYLYLYIYKIK
jgi:hypothetical protein